MLYTLLICDDETAVVSEADREARLEAFIAFSQRLGAEGKVVGGQRLRPTSTENSQGMAVGGNSKRSVPRAVPSFVKLATDTVHVNLREALIESTA